MQISCQPYRRRHAITQFGDNFISVIEAVANLCGIEGSVTVFGQGLFFNGFRGRKEGSVVVGRTSPRYGRGDDSCETTVTLTALRAVQEMWCHFSRVDAAEAQMLEQRVKTENERRIREAYPDRKGFFSQLMVRGRVQAS